ncbi:VOC family protein [Pikeienuella piscinae]|uniref:VOC family protein n=1 Tax=Pikeienuella piscinae TaxID=2748098 RepID=A0A7L5BTK3_9RHOB|nr:VOC family protein [Pikeienuella piscinae]QIE54782.1 VOC family protein [Pikeienuella piscinae]
MTGRAIDHVVLKVANLDRAAATYESLGFTLTPRARHEDRMGTSNRIAQFEEMNFIELLEVDRPEGLMAHDFSARPPVFSFGAHNRSATRDGASMLVFASEDARADNDAFAKAGLQTFAPFDFERKGRLPDGAEATLSFSLAFSRAPEAPEAPIFVCQNRAPGLFWKVGYQRHENGATGIRALWLASAAPAREADFYQRLFGGRTTEVEGGVDVSCGANQTLRIRTAEQVAVRDPGFDAAAFAGPRFVGVEIAGPTNGDVPSDAACGMFISWVKR